MWLSTKHQVFWIYTNTNNYLEIKLCYRYRKTEISDIMINHSNIYMFLNFENVHK